MLAQTEADVRAAPRGGARDHAQRQACVAQPCDGRSGARQRPPRHAEDAVHVEQKPVDVRERHGPPEPAEPPCEWCRSRGSNPDAAEATGDFKSPASTSSATPAREEYTTRAPAGAPAGALRPQPVLS